MQSVSWQIKLFRSGRLVERRENAPDFFDMLLVETAPIVVFVKAAQAAMLKTKNHKSKCNVTSVTCQVMFNNFN